MVRMEKKKFLSFLIILCMLFGLTGQTEYVQGSEVLQSEGAAGTGGIDLSSQGEAGPGALSVLSASPQSVTGSAITYYVGGGNATEGGDGSAGAPFTTLKKAADVINSDTDGGSYQIILLGNTSENASVVFGNDSNQYNYDITVSNSVTGSAVTVSKALTDNFMIQVRNNTSLTIEGYSDTALPGLVFDGGGESLSGGFALFYINNYGTLIMNGDIAIQNNIETQGNISGAGVFNQGTFIMNGGCISSNKAGYTGGGVYNKSVFTMNGGKISGNNTVSFGGGICNEGTFTMNEGAEISANYVNAISNQGNTTMNGGRIAENICSEAVLNMENGSFSMLGGYISDNTSNNTHGCNGVRIASGTFNLKGGFIENNTGLGVCIVSGELDMSGGYIRNNKSNQAGVLVAQKGIFDMSGGEISGNEGYAVYMYNSIKLSGSAVIKGKDNDTADIYIYNDLSDYTIDIGDSLNNITSLRIKPRTYKEGKQVLTGSGLSAQTISKCTLDNTNYSIDSAGKIYYSGAPITYFVNAGGSNGVDTSGSSTQPLATIDEAVKRIGTSHGVIILQSDLNITARISIGTNITIKSDGQTRTLHQKIPYSGIGFDSMFFVNFGTLSLGDKDQTQGSLVIENDLNELPKLVWSANGSVINLYQNAIIQNGNFSKGTIYNENSVFNLNGGTISGNKGIAVYNLSGTVNINGGTINAAASDSGTGISNCKDYTVNIAGGTISGFDTAGIINFGNLNLSGGTISNNLSGIDNRGGLVLSGNASIPAGTSNTNTVLLTGDTFIETGDNLALSDGNFITVSLYTYQRGHKVLSGNSEVIAKNSDNIVLSDEKYGVSTKGYVEYIGEPVVCYVNQDYAGSDSDGSIEKPFTYLLDAVSEIDNTVEMGIINICSDLVIDTDIVVKSDITIQNYGNPHTISRYKCETGEYTECFFRIVNEGILNLGSAGSGNDAAPSLFLFGGSTTANSGLIVNDGKLNLYPGVKIYGNDTSDNFATIDNGGEFNMYGGIIAGNHGQCHGCIYNKYTFTMYGGTICDNTSDENGGGVSNDEYSVFRFKGGKIKNNSAVRGGGIYNFGTFEISGDASVPSVNTIRNDIYLALDSIILIADNLGSTDKMIVIPDHYIPGKQLLGGSADILRTNYNLFTLDASVKNYSLSDDGTLKYTGLLSDIYVDKNNTSETPDGTRNNPYTTLKAAVASIESNTGVGTIHISSDLDINQPVIINGSITLVNEGDPHIIRRSADFIEDSSDMLSLSDYGMLIVLGKLALGDGTGDASINLTIDGNMDHSTYNGALISNYGVLQMYNGITLSNNYNGGVYNEKSFAMYGGVIRNNKGSGGVMNFSNSGKPVFTMAGGSINNNQGNCGGITCFDTTACITGGNIRDNQGNYGAGIYLTGSDLSMSGGTIAGNTDMDATKPVLGKGIYVDNHSTIKLSGNVSIISDNDVLLCRDNYSRSVITVSSPLSGETPAILVKTITYPETSDNYHIGDQVIVPGEGYSLTGADILKFTLASDDYGINNTGIIAQAVKDSWVTLKDADNMYYTGSEHKPTVTVVNGTVTLIQGKDYQVSYSKNINAGTAEVIISGIGNYGGNVIKSFIINKASVKRIITDAPKDMTFKVSEGKSLEDLILAIPLKNATVELEGATAVLPVAWALTSGTYDGKGGTYIFTGTLTGNDNITPGDNKLTVQITITEKPTPTPTPTPTPAETPTSAPTSTPTLAPTPVPEQPDIDKAPREIEADASIIIDKSGNDEKPHAKVTFSGNGITDSAGTDPTVIKLPVSSDKLSELLRNTKSSGIDIDAAVPDFSENKNIIGCDIMLDADILKTAKKANKDITVSVKDEEGSESYSWTFYGKDLSKSDTEITDINLSLKVETAKDNKKLADLLSKEALNDRNSNSLLINFSHHGDLPSQASVRINVGDMGYKAGDTLYLYYYNSYTGRLETLPYSGYQVDRDGFVTINIVHCSDYVLFLQKADSSIITTLLDQVSVTPVKLTLYRGGTTDSTAVINIGLPSTLELIKDFSQKTCSSAIGAVAAAYKSGNNKVAAVDGTGRITARRTGSAVITAAVTLYSGKTRTFRINVTVKKPTVKMVSSTDIMKTGDSFTFKAESFGLDSNDIVWTTAKKFIVTVNRKTGKATAVSKGTDYVIATINNVSVRVKVTVK